MTMTAAELLMFRSYVDASTNYLEFGSGESTVYAAGTAGIISIDSVESSAEFINDYLETRPEIQKARTAGRLKFHMVDIGPTVKWGYPKDDTKKHLWPNYCSKVFSRKSSHDLVFVDGRFRIACTLNSILHTPDNCTIMIHDFWNRPEYHGVLKFLNVKDRTDTLGVFTKKKPVNPAKLKPLIQEYQYLPGDQTFLYRLEKRLKSLVMGDRDLIQSH
ncbi:MAG: hypothetical protein K8I00_08085 [Candidatus Omnitrophica bacterium]|nr:hypothetical protein [Candidatus Omnitrophota bacterium]